MANSELTPLAKAENEKRHDNDDSTIGSSKIPDQLFTVWIFFVTQWRRLTKSFYDWMVGFAAGFVADVLSDERVLARVNIATVGAVNAFMEQEDIGTKMDITARRVIYDREKARDAARDIGKEVVPMVTGFVGGVAASFAPSAIKKRKQKRRQREKDSRNDSNFLSSLTTEEFSDEDEDYLEDESNRSGNSAICAPNNSKN